MLIIDMPVVFVSKTLFSGSASLTVGTETTIVELVRDVSEQEFVAEGYLDLSQFASSETLEIREYIDPDGTGYRLYSFVRLVFPVDAPLVWLHPKIIGQKYKITATQLTGTARSIPYWIWKFVYGSV